MGVKNIRRKMADGSSGSRRIARGVDVAAAAEVIVGKPERGGRSESDDGADEDATSSSGYDSSSSLRLTDDDLFGGGNVNSASDASTTGRSVRHLSSNILYPHNLLAAFFLFCIFYSL